MTQLPQRVQLRDGRVAELDHSTVYFEDPREGEERPPNGQVFAYYRVDDVVHRVPIRVKYTKLSQDQIPGLVALLIGVMDRGVAGSRRGAGG